MDLPGHERDTMASPLSEPRSFPHPQDVSETVIKPARVVGFWTAVALPFLHIPFLMMGLDSTTDTLAFLGLFALNVVALVVGHPHGDS